MSKTEEPTAEQIAAAEALLAGVRAKQDAERQAKAEAATAAVRTLVASPEFKAALPAFEAAFEGAPRDTELGYAVQMMERLRDRFPA